MSEALSEKSVEILSAIQAGVESSVGFAQEQLPDVAQQYVLFGRVNETATVILLMLATITSAVFALRNWRVEKFEEHTAFLVVGCMALSIILSLVAASNISNLIMVWFAP